jgi:hypothetical protein
MADGTASYLELVASKVEHAPMRGLQEVPQLHGALKDHQRDVTGFLLRAGCGSAFLDTGLGKTFIELEWSRVLHEHLSRPVLMLAPLAVSHQHKREADKFGILATVVRHADEVSPGINITNYERLHLFDPAAFGAIVLDERRRRCVFAIHGYWQRRRCGAANEATFYRYGTAPNVLPAGVQVSGRRCIARPARRYV